MSKNSRILPFLLAVALGGAGPADVRAAAQAGAEVVDNSLFRAISDRLSVLYLMDGRTEDAVRLQKETMAMINRPVPADLVRSRGGELVALLDEAFKEDEARKFRAKLEDAGIALDTAPAASASAAPSAAPRPEYPPVAAPAPDPEPAPAKPAPAPRQVVEEKTVVVRNDAGSAEQPQMAVVKVRRAVSADTAARTDAPAPAKTGATVKPAPAPVPARPAAKPAPARVATVAPRPAPAPTAVKAVTPAPAAATPEPAPAPRIAPSGAVSVSERLKQLVERQKVVEEETVTVEETVAPPAEPKRAVVTVRRVQEPVAAHVSAPVSAPVPAPAPAVATAPAKIAKVVKKTYLTVPPSMVVPVAKKPKPLSEPLFPKKVNAAPVQMPDPVEPVKSVSLAPKRDNTLRDLSTIKVSLEFRDVQLADLVRLLAGKANLNIVSKNPITGQTTVNFQEIPIGTALDTVLKTNGYSYEVRDGVVWVYRVGEEPLETRVFFLRHALVYDVLPIVQNSLQELDGAERPPSGPTASRPAAGTGQVPAQAAASAAPAAAGAPAQGGQARTAGGGNAPTVAGTPGGSGAPAGAGAQATGGAASVDAASGGQAPAGGSTAAAPRAPTSGRWSIQPDERSNALIVLASRPKLDEVARLLEVFDVSTENRQMQEQIFKLKYIDKNTLVKAIQMVLPRFDPDKQMLEVRRVDGGAAAGASGSGGSGSSGGGMSGSGGGGGMAGGAPGGM